VLMDLQVTGLDAITFTRLIRQLNNEIQVIVLASSDEDKSLIQAALKAGAVISLHKSVSADELAQAIETAYADRLIPPQRTGDAPTQDQLTRLR
jgi:DNA-binding NarL/FixJ family response regulator